MRPLHRRIAVGAVQCLMLLSVAGKYEIDRARLPRVWVNATPVDPYLPIRGRYISLQLQVDVAEPLGSYSPVRLYVEDGRLKAAGDPNNGGLRVLNAPQRAWILSDPVDYFLSEHAADPSRLGPGEELWVEVSVPKKGPPRPLRLAIKKDGNLTPLGSR